VAKDRPDAITIICTNLKVAPSVAKLERETGIPIYDTIATVVWKCLKLAGVDTRRVSDWGSLFQQVA
jgi:maleate isomerase